MGYNSNFVISKYNEENNRYETISKEEIEKLNEISNYRFDGPYLYETNWYSIIEDMQKFSKIYPNYKWIVEQEGEDRDDYRKYIFKNGKYKELYATVNIIYPKEEEIEWRE